MKNRKKAVIFVIVFCIIAVTVMCFRTNFGAYKRQIFAMDTYCSLEIRGGGKKVLDELEKTINYYDQKYNAYDEKSLIYSLNDDGKSYDEETVKLTKILLDYNKKTEGAFDFSLKKLSDLWGFPKKLISEPEKIDFSTFGADKVEIEDNQLLLDGVEVDFGGVMKGYTADKLRERLVQNKIYDAVLNLGGNVLVLGKHKVGIQDPADKNELLCAIDVMDKAVVTSGIYQRTFPDKNGVMRHHILNPKTGYPADSGIVSVTVIGKNATECDVLSTAFLVLGKEKTNEIMRKFDVEIIMLCNDKTVYCTPNIAEDLEVFSGYTKEVF